MTTATATIHPFESAGLGKAPFRFMGIEEKVHVVGGIGATTLPGGTCDYCGTGIRYCCKIKSADGRLFVVGCDCVVKVDSEGSRLLSDMERAKRDMATKARHAKADGTIASARAALAGVKPKLADKPHPHPAFTDKTLADWCEWMLANAGRSGQLDAAKVILKHA